MTMEPVFLAVFLTVLGVAVVCDLRSARIPNWLTFPAMGFALAGHAWLGGMAEALFSMAGLGTGLGLFFVLYRAGAMGAGDVKLMAAIGAFVGLWGVLSSAWIAIVIGGVYAIAAMCYQWGLAATGQRLLCAGYGAVLSRGTGWMKDIQLPFKLRYGLAIVAGTLLYQLGLQPFGG